MSIGDITALLDMGPEEVPPMAKMQAQRDPVIGGYKTDEVLIYLISNVIRWRKIRINYKNVIEGIRVRARSRPRSIRVWAMRNSMQETEYAQETYKVSHYSLIRMIANVRKDQMYQEQTFVQISHGRSSISVYGVQFLLQDQGKSDQASSE